MRETFTASSSDTRGDRPPEWPTIMTYTLASVPAPASVPVKVVIV
jgi:hypothetical protein